MAHKFNILSRLQQLEEKSPEQRAFVFNVCEDFKGPKAMRKELDKKKYENCVIILNDIK